MLYKQKLFNLIIIFIKLFIDLNLLYNLKNFDVIKIF